MGHSRSGFPLFTLFKIRGARGVMKVERGTQEDSPRGREDCLARAER